MIRKRVKLILRKWNILRKWKPGRILVEEKLINKGEIIRCLCYRELQAVKKLWERKMGKFSSNKEGDQKDKKIITAKLNKINK